jgi:hypothetical protein
MFCHRGTAGHLAMCVAPSNPSEDREVFAPLPPAILLDQDAVTGPHFLDEKLCKRSDLAHAGFPSTPFEPPRS